MEMARASFSETEGTRFLDVKGEHPVQKSRMQSAELRIEDPLHFLESW